MEAKTLRTKPCHFWVTRLALRATAVLRSRATHACSHPRVPQQQATLWSAIPAAALAPHPPGQIRRARHRRLEALWLFRRSALGRGRTPCICRYQRLRTPHRAAASSPADPALTPSRRHAALGTSAPRPRLDRCSLCAASLVRGYTYKTSKFAPSTSPFLRLTPHPLLCPPSSRSVVVHQLATSASVSHLFVHLSDSSPLAILTPHPILAVTDPLQHVGTCSGARPLRLPPLG